jgi:hypothetical protein
VNRSCLAAPDHLCEFVAIGHIEFGARAVDVAISRRGSPVRVVFAGRCLASSPRALNDQLVAAVKERIRPCTKTDAALADRLSGTTEVGEVWRCLRCGEFTLGEPKRRGAAEDAPMALRGKALRQAKSCRLLLFELQEAGR